MAVLFRASLIVALAVAGGCRPGARTAVTLATTTSVAHSGLLDALASEFTRERGVEIRSHLVGSGRALAMLESGDADVAITHAPETETAVLRRQPGWRYTKLMFNDFVVVGPAADPAKVRGAPTVEESFRRIAASGERFISRGDESGTHERERSLWALAGAQPRPENLVVAGQGMGTTLRIADETVSYTLTDRATFAQNAARIGLQIVFEGSPRLLNTYAVIVPGARAAGGEFASWLTVGRGRDVIAGYQAGGVALFTPWPAGAARNRPADLPFD